MGREYPSHPPTQDISSCFLLSYKPFELGPARLAGECAQSSQTPTSFGGAAEWLPLEDESLVRWPSPAQLPNRVARFRAGEAAKVDFHLASFGTLSIRRMSLRRE
ncbi:unnamed protein product [Protopolystoma xenopodis]|uniref:Uncharacterized protein n=1 Tax=Protopolystoma xenopodis TaxID=117903 RepID=A0A448WKT5_9PLAT|nr:unnamed protein product [Protopolystoma xenopodis]